MSKKKVSEDRATERYMREVASMFEQKARRLNELADQLGNPNIDMSIGGMQQVAREYTGTLCHNSLGATEFTAYLLTDLIASAAYDKATADAAKAGA